MKKPDLTQRNAEIIAQWISGRSARDIGNTFGLKASTIPALVDLCLIEEAMSVLGEYSKQGFADCWKAYETKKAHYKMLRMATKKRNEMTCKADKLARFQKRRGNSAPPL